jgi:hypothetical protein
MVQIKVQSIELIGEQISILFDKAWFQEDITTLSQLLLSILPEHSIKETTIGADRECVRFMWSNAEFMLNFDYYSQSCWFSALDKVSTAQIQPVYNALINHV